MGRHPSSRASNIGTLAEEDASNIQETPRSNDSGSNNDNGGNNDDGNESDDDDESEVSQMSD